MVNSDSGIDLGNIVYTTILVVIFLPTLSALWSLGLLKWRRKLAIAKLEKKFKCRIITLIHRQEGGLFGFPLFRMISIEDSESILKAIYLTASHIPIYLIVHTPGGIALAAEQIARALDAHKAEIKMFVPYWAMSGGTLIGLACDKIVMTPNAIIGSIDPQLPTGLMSSLPASSIVKALEVPNENRDDKFVALGDVARKALKQMQITAYELMKGKVDENRREELSKTISQGTWTHDYPITYERARDLGLPVSRDCPLEILRFMGLYKQPSSVVEYTKSPFASVKENL